MISLAERERSEGGGKNRREKNSEGVLGTSSSSLSSLLFICLFVCVADCL